MKNNRIESKHDMLRNLPDIPLKYFLNHKCVLPPEKLSSTKIRCSKFCRFFVDLVTVNYNDIRAQRIYMSYKALAAEKCRQYKNYPLTIHPYSKLRSGLEAFFFMITVLANFTLSIKYSETDPGTDDILGIFHISLDYLFLLHILVNFFTGHISGDTHQFAVLNLKSIFWKYARTWLFLDVISVMAAVVNRYTMATNVSTEVVVAMFDVFRIPRMMLYAHNTFTVVNTGLRFTTAMEIFILLSTYISWNITFQFASEYIAENSFWPMYPRSNSWLTLADLWGKSTGSRFVYALERAVTMSRESANISMISTQEAFELFFAIAWIIAKLTTFLCTLRYITVLFGTESARAKYFMMSQQVEKYMNQKRFPPKLKKKILKYYAIKFQSHFFVESRMMGCISGQLREDIIMHLSRQLVQNVTFLKQLPKSLLLQIGFTIKADIFIAGDVIYKINTIGDCLYFIDKGTVAEYTESGREIWHLEDGDYFGEIALVLKQKFRTTSAVAVTNCELFRLDREGFESSVGCYPVVYEHIKKEAQVKFEKACMLDDFHKAQMRMKGFY